jgi:Na+/H+ antiporter NhaA
MAAGIGFTVAIFMTGISLTDPALQDEAKIGIFAASAVAAVLSAVVLGAGRRSGGTPAATAEGDGRSDRDRVLVAEA